MNPNIDSRRFTRTQKNARTHFACEVVTQQKGHKIFLRYINCLKKNNLKYLEEIMWWLISTKDTRLIPFDFIFRTELIPLIQTLLLNSQLITADFHKNIVFLLRIVSVLTSLHAPPHDFFSSPEILEVFFEFLRSQNSQDIVKYTLLNLSQFVMKNPELLLYYHVKINIFDLLGKVYLRSDNCEISGISSFFLCQVAAFSQNNEISNNSIQLLFNFTPNSHPQFILTLFKGIVFHSSISPFFMSIIIENNFFGLCSQIIPVLHQSYTNRGDNNNNNSNDYNFKILNTLFSVFSILITTENGYNSFLKAGLIDAISHLNFLLPNNDQLGAFCFAEQERVLICQLLHVFGQLIMIGNTEIDASLIRNNIFQQICQCAFTAVYDTKICALSCVCAAIQRKHKQFCQIIAESNGIQAFFETYETFDVEMTKSMLIAFFEILEIDPNIKNLFANLLDFDVFTNQINQFEDCELSDKAQLLINVCLNC